MKSLNKEILNPKSLISLIVSLRSLICSIACNLKLKAVVF